MPEPLPEDLRAALDESRSRRGGLGEPAVFFTQIGSTNDAAAALAERGAPEGAMVVASAQTAGRGRLGRAWHSAPGAGLYVSIVCRNRDAAPWLTLAGGVAVADGIRRATGLPVQIKWPNDVVVPDLAAPGGRRKLAGILAEASTGPEGLQYVVLGFGINLRPTAYPGAVAATATSIERELGRPIEAAPLLVEVLVQMREQLSAVSAGRDGDLLARWRALAPPAAGSRVEWTADGHVRRGTTAGIDDRGALLVRSEGRTERIISGELTWT